MSLLLVVGCATSSPHPARAPDAQHVIHAHATLAAAPPRFGSVSPAALQAWAQGHGTLTRGGPRTGQVALFGEPGHQARWAGRVERVDADGTVVLLMDVKGQPVRLRMNLKQPALRRHPTTHRVLNHYLDSGADGKSPHTTAQRWLGCVSLPEAPHLVADAR